MATSSDQAVLGSPAPEFRLRGTDGKFYSYGDVAGERGTVIVFICNHCPYVKAAIERIVRDAAALEALGIGIIAIMSNDATAYPADSFDNMKAFAGAHGITFPYVVDESQDVARVYDAVCTPDFFGFDRNLTLAYHGRLDSGGRSVDVTAKRDLYDAMAQVARTGRAPVEQHASIGCTIKWRKPPSSKEWA